MKKAKVITSALLSVVMCAGIVCALTASAEEAASKPEQDAAETQILSGDESAIG